MSVARARAARARLANEPISARRSIEDASQRRGGRACGQAARRRGAPRPTLFGDGSLREARRLRMIPPMISTALLGAALALQSPGTAAPLTSAQNPTFEEKVLTINVAKEPRPTDTVAALVPALAPAPNPTIGSAGFANAFQISSQSSALLASLQDKDKSKQGTGSSAAGGDTTNKIAPTDRPKGGLDPTQRETYFGVRADFAQLPLDQNLTDVTGILQGFIPLDDKMAIQGNVEFPIAFYTPGLTNNGDHSGLGDMVIQGDVLYQSSTELGHAIGAKLQLNTSTADELGQNATILEPFYAMSLRETDMIRYVGIVSYRFSISHENGVPYTSELIFRPRAIVDLEDYNYASFEIPLAFNFNRVNGTEGIDSSIRLEIGRFFDEKRAIQGFVRFEAPIDRYTRDFVEEFIFSIGINFNFNP
jgi:hypothetical protein